MSKDKDINVVIETGQGVFEGVFEVTTKIREVIAAVVKELGLASGDVFELHLNGDPLEPTDRPLVSFGLEDGATLMLVATGTGV